MVVVMVVEMVVVMGCVMVVVMVVEMECVVVVVFVCLAIGSGRIGEDGGGVDVVGDLSCNQ